MINAQDILPILTKHDPVGIIMENSLDEYEQEAKSIAKRLNDVNHKSAIVDIVHEEFIKWFGKETVGRRDKYNKIASGIADINGRNNY